MNTQRIWTRGDVCSLASAYYNELRAQGYAGTAIFRHERVIDRVHPTTMLKMRNRKTGELVAIKWIGEGDRNVHLYSK